MSKKNFMIMTFIISFVLLTGAVYHVDGDYPFESNYNRKTIQSAINSAVNGDLILVHEYSGGVYGPISLGAKGLEIRAYLSDTVYIEDNGTSTTCIEITQTCAIPTKFKGFIIQNGNNSSGAGGIFASHRRNVEFQDCEIISNTGTSGGGIWLLNGVHVKLQDCRISENSAICGGGVFINDSSLNMENVEITANEADFGGAIYYRPLDTNIVIVGDYILISDNEANMQGGAFYIHLESIEDNLLELTKSTISGNVSTSGLGGFYIYDQSGGDIDISINSSIIWGNDGSPQIASGYEIDYSCIEQNSVYAGTGNTKDDPEFIDASNGDYHLDWNSSGIDSGDPSLDDDPDGTRIDMGFYRADDHDHWEFTESELGEETVIWRGLPRLDVGGANTGQLVNANALLDRFEYPDNPDGIQVWYKSDDPIPDLGGYWNGEEYVWNTDPCNDLINSIRGFKFKVWGDIPEESQLLVFGRIISPSISIEVDVIEDEDGAWVNYFLEETQFASSALDNPTLDKLEKVITKNWTAVKYHDVWGWPALATLTYGDLVILVPDEEEEENFSFCWQSSTRDDIEPYIRPVPTQFNYSEELEYIPIFMDFNENQPIEVGLFINDVCRGAEVVDTDSLFHLRAYIMDEAPGQELEFVFYDGRSENRVMGYKVKEQYSSYGYNRLKTGELREYVCIEFTEPMDEQAAEYEIDIQTFPNPFNPMITISFQATENGSIDLEIYNIKGQKVKTLLSNNYVHSGNRIDQVWYGLNDFGETVSDGIYFVNLRSKSGMQTEKVLLLK